VTATLYGVGAGPGASDLMTLRAVRLLQRVPVIACPRATPWSESMAWKIVAPEVGDVPGQVRVFLEFPMSHDHAKVRKAWDRAMDVIGGHLSAGRDVAFVAEGDPSLYSSFGYMARFAGERFPTVKIEVIPGVTSVTAVPAVAGLPLADGRERLAILPAGYDLGDLDQVLASFDTVVLMKIGPHMPKVVDAIARAGLADRAVYVSRATMADQRIVRDLSTMTAASGDCFAMVVVTRRERAGSMGGENLDVQLEALS
jgi:precorrin-2/cobalt-factor-2 C20-methyltransferase